MRLDSIANVLARVARRSPSPALPAFALAVGALFVPTTAQAHFTLDYPPPWIVQDSFGDPQKASPCGTDSASPGTPTGEITTFAPGQVITLKFTETVAHDGWYRISISYKDRADLSDPPYQTYSSGLMSGWSEDAGIEDPVVAPVVLDGILKHSGATEQTPHSWSYPLTIPDEPCAKCTLQVEEIMLNHPVNQADGPFTYHHCADIAIVAGGDGGTTAKGADGGTIVVTVDGGPPSGPGTATSSGGSIGSGSGGSGSTGSASGATGDSEGSDGTSDGTGNGGSNGAGASDSGSSGSSGCDASGRGTTAAASLGLLVGAAIAGVRRRRRRPAP
jgi:hypothetical protein